LLAPNLLDTMRFEVKLGNAVVGFSELEGGDAPMGIALGRLFPTPAYSSIQPYCINHRERWAAIPELTVGLVGGAPIQCSGGIQIIDFSPELGEAGIQIHLNGVTNPPYSELFPHHVEAYKKQFRPDHE
jgi:hypothetical protein